MLLAIPNPKKNLTIDFALERVKIGVERLSNISNKYKFTKSNPVFNQYTFEATEFLSLGVMGKFKKRHNGQTQINFNFDTS